MKSKLKRTIGYLMKLWEEGNNENFNGVLRQTYPKGTIFLEIPDDELEKTVERIRNRPRKVLNYFTTNEIFLENM
jgi:IS30 family transposase